MRRGIDVNDWKEGGRRKDEEAIERGRGRSKSIMKYKKVNRKKSQ